MAISKKKRRSIEYQRMRFLWWVKDDFDGNGNMLSVHVASEDKKFIIEHFLVKLNTAKSYLTIVGHYFPGLDKRSGNSIRIVCPDFRSAMVDNVVTPKTIRSILEWCFQLDKEIDLYDK